MTPLVLHLPPLLPSLPLRLRRDAQVEEHGADVPAGPPPTGSEPEFATLVCPPLNLVGSGLVGNQTLGLLGLSMIGVVPPDDETLGVVGRPEDLVGPM
jgi:hypothetical protein